MNLLDVEVRDQQHGCVALREVAQHVTLIVNIACATGFEVNEECKDLQHLYQRYKGHGFTVLAFPCDQFGSESRKKVTEQDVQKDLESRFGVTFPIFGKVHVNGDHAHPLFITLQKQLTESTFKTQSGISWDFTKFLVVDGEPKRRYAPTTSPQLMEQDIQHFLESSAGDESIQHPRELHRTNARINIFEEQSRRPDTTDLDMQGMDMEREARVKNEAQEWEQGDRGQAQGNRGQAQGQLLGGAGPGQRDREEPQAKRNEPVLHKKTPATGFDVLKRSAEAGSQAKGDSTGSRRLVQKDRDDDVDDEQAVRRNVD